MQYYETLIIKHACLKISELLTEIVSNSMNCNFLEKVIIMYTEFRSGLHFNKLIFAIFRPFSVNRLRRCTSTIRINFVTELQNNELSMSEHYWDLIKTSRATLQNSFI